MLIFQPPVNFWSDENIQTIFGTKLQDFSHYRIDYNSISRFTRVLKWPTPAKKGPIYTQTRQIIVIYLTSSCVNWAFFGMSGPD
jgi:hypothetical protein